MQQEGLDTVTLKKLALSDTTPPDLKQWDQFLRRHKNPKHEVTIGLVGKYVELQDSYKSILESFIHAGASNEVRVNVRFIHSEHISKKTNGKILQGLDGILVAPGFGERGIEGKIEAVRYARENNIPFLGICLGMQLLATFSEERNTKCLDVVKTIVKEFYSNKVKVPHMGWNQVEYKNQNKLFANVECGKNFYFANSFYVPVTEYTIASTNYEVIFSAALNKNNFYGVQFHPEKSGRAGLQLLRNFIELC